jgi:hypothetical protein
MEFTTQTGGKMILHTDTAWNLIGFDSEWDGAPAEVRIQGGRTLYEAVMFIDNGLSEKPRLARLVTDGGLRQINRYVDPDTVLEIVR